MQKMMEQERPVFVAVAKLVNVLDDRIDDEITATLQQIGESCRLDRCALMELARDKTGARATHVVCGEGIAAAPQTCSFRDQFCWTGENLMRGDIVCFSTPADLPLLAALDQRHYEAIGVQSCLAIPLCLDGSVTFFIVAHQVRVIEVWRKETISLLCLAGEVFVNVLARRRELQSKTDYHTGRVCSHRHEQLIGQSEALAKTLLLAEQVAPTDSTVLITGETGTGKELIALTIHELSMRRNRPMVKVNCASLPAALVESELFGREKGAYTGALTRQAGRFEAADGSTLFLDEIGEMSLELQAKLLRVLQEGQFERLGSTKTIQVNVRVIAASNRNLVEEVKKGNFREDLFYRLNVFQIVMPQLRERVEDIPLLAWAFVDEFCEKMGRKINKISKQDMAALQRYQWPGNVRELRNVIEYAVIVSTCDQLQVRLPEGPLEKTSPLLTLEQYETMHIREALQLTNWRIKGEGGAARLLGLNPSTLYSRMQKLGINNHRVQNDVWP